MKFIRVFDFEGDDIYVNPMQIATIERDYDEDRYKWYFDLRMANGVFYRVIENDDLKKLTGKEL